MPPEPRPALGMRSILATSLVVAGALAAAAPAHALRIVNYNVTNYPSVMGAARDPYFRTILAPLGADVVAVQEMQNAAGVTQFLANLNANEPGQWAAAPFFNGNDTDNALFYKPSKVSVLGAWAFYPNAANLLRFVTVWRLAPAGYDHTELRIYSQHLKASTGSTNVNQRAAEATGIRDSMNNVPAGTCSILLGDFNIYTSTEPAFGKLLEVQADNDGRLADPLNATGTFNAAQYAPIHTQCPCLTCPAGTGFSGGGLDDRFDMFLPTYTLMDSEGLDLLVPTYKPVGNDGLHYNLNINDPPTIPEGSAYANALWNASDHLPVRVDLQLPAKIAAPASLAFGTVIGGASADLAVANPAEAPADELNASLAAPLGFLAAPGDFTVNAGAVEPVTISTSPDALGDVSGDLVIASDDPDHPITTVSLSATVLSHAQASLDSSDVVTQATIDFGGQFAGGFSDQLVRVHDRGYQSTQARLSIESGVIAGGDGRFSLVGDFHAALVADTGESYEVRFDDAGATPDSTYEATLTFGSADEPLPGALAQPDLVVTLRARVVSGSTGVGDAARPTATRLLAPFPNPLSRASTLRFDLAEAGPARLDVFDLGGRRVATIADRDFEPGHYGFEWKGVGEDGTKVGPGLFFVRLSLPGRATQSARIAVVR